MTTAADHAPSRSCYQRGCRLPDCVAINYRYEKGVNYDLSCGRRRQIDSQQVRVHIERLRANGWTRRQIAKAAGTSRSVIYQLAAGQPTVRANNARLVLSVRIVAASSKTLVDATGSMRRIQALAAIGHTLRTIAAETRFGHSKIEHIAAGLIDQVDTATAETITNVYRRLASKTGSSAQTKALARKKGWHGPLAWDDIDDPNCKPEKAKPYAAAGKYRRDPDRKREIEHLYLLGESVPSIAKQLGGNEKYINDQLTVILRERAAKAEQERTQSKQLAVAA